MGQGYSFRCKQCGYEEDLLDGSGFMVHGLSVEEYLSHPFMKFHHATHRKILRLKEKINGLQIYCAYKDFICPSCNIPFSKLYIEVYKNTRTYHQSYFRCKNCHKELEEQKIDLTRIYRCPKCYEGSFGFADVMIHWD
jgi:Zn finger protein HypA/HybF involved in hydrogenase expression